MKDRIKKLEAVADAARKVAYPGPDKEPMTPHVNMIILMNALSELDKETT